MKSLMVQMLEANLQTYLKERANAEDTFINANYIGNKIDIINARVEMIKTYENIKIAESKLKIALARGRYESNSSS